MKAPVHRRHPAVTGMIGLAALVALFLAAFNVADLPLIGGGTGYTAAFRDASGLAPDNEVRVAGVKVGKVTGISLARDSHQAYVRVAFRIDDRELRLGSDTQAAIEIKTVLGQKYLALAPAGAQPLAPGAQIPLSRTASPFDVVDAVNGLADTLDHIDTAQLAQAFTVLSKTFESTPAATRTTLSSLSHLTSSIAARDTELRTLLSHARAVTGVLANRNEELQKLVADGNLLLTEVIQRRDAIHELLVSTTELATQLSGLVADNRSRLRPALTELHDVLAVLQRDRDNLELTVQKMAPFINAFTNVLGNGRWFDSYLGGLLQPYTPSTGGN